jgi:hypothetical protein
MTIQFFTKVANDTQATQDKLANLIQLRAELAKTCINEGYTVTELARLANVTRQALQSSIDTVSKNQEGKEENMTYEAAAKAVTGDNYVARKFRNLVAVAFRESQYSTQRGISLHGWNEDSYPVSVKSISVEIEPGDAEIEEPTRIDFTIEVEAPVDDYASPDVVNEWRGNFEYVFNGDGICEEIAEAFLGATGLESDDSYVVGGGIMVKGGE